MCVTVFLVLDCVTARMRENDATKFQWTLEEFDNVKEV